MNVLSIYFRDLSNPIYFFNRYSPFLFAQRLFFISLLFAGTLCRLFSEPDKSAKNPPTNRKTKRLSGDSVFSFKHFTCYRAFFNTRYSSALP